MHWFIKYPQMGGEIQQSLKCPSLLIKHTGYVGHGYRVQDVELQEDTSNSRRDTSEMVCCCLLLLVNRDQNFKCCRPL